VRLEAGSGDDDVVVVDEQQRMVGVPGVVVLSEGEGVLGVQPTEVGLGSIAPPRSLLLLVFPPTLDRVVTAP